MTEIISIQSNEAITSVREGRRPSIASVGSNGEEGLPAWLKDKRRPSTMSISSIQDALSEASDCESDLDSLVGDEIEPLSEEDIKIIENLRSHYKNFQHMQGELEEVRLTNFMKVFSATDKITLAIDYIVRQEIKENKIGLLREESFGANLVKSYWLYSEGKEYLEKVVKPLVKAVIKETKKYVVDIDPFRVDPEYVAKNTKRLYSLIDDFLKVFLNSHSMFPSNFRVVMKSFYTLLTESEGIKSSHLGLGYSEDALRLFGGFLILRFICPAIVSPVKFGLVKEISPQAQRTLVLCSKIVLAIANQVEFEGEKESYMIPTNPYICGKIPDMLAFMTSLMDSASKSKFSKKVTKDKKSKSFAHKKKDKDHLKSSASGPF